MGGPGDQESGQNDGYMQQQLVEGQVSLIHYPFLYKTNVKIDEFLKWKIRISILRNVVQL